MSSLLHRRLRYRVGQGGCVSVVERIFEWWVWTKLGRVGFSVLRGWVLSLQGVLVSLRRVLKSVFQFFSVMFPGGFKSVLDYQEELGVCF